MDLIMQNNSDDYVVYNNKTINKNHFRAFIYNIDGVNRRLVENWDSYQQFISSGLWSDTMPVIEKQQLKAEQKLQEFNKPVHDVKKKNKSFKG
jgi:hypothetical protein